jgi:EAL domain-containing protein (putative c-di-GMP-specific phosphodiesterase class I)
MPALQVSLDDFGTGYSSLTYLQRSTSTTSRSTSPLCATWSRLHRSGLCKAIIVMAHANWACKVIAEGVETAQQRDLLASVGCDFVQGYLYARPMPVADFEVFIANYTPIAASGR